MALGRKTGGRKKGTPNKPTPLREAAREYSQEALATLAEVMRNTNEPAAARVSAANALLDRGYGRPNQILSGDEEGGPVVHKIELVPLESADSTSA